MTATYDLIVLGGGPVGENVADYAHQGGLSVVVVESELVGGECSYWACIPSKTLLRPGSAVRAALRVEGAREVVTGRLDPALVFARRDAVVGDYDDGSQVEWLKSTGIDLIRGHGRLTGPRRVTVTAIDGTLVELEARRAVAVSTGSDPVVPPIEGLREAKPWTSRDATGATTAPKSLVVLGGGVVACEMATLYNSLGTEVTMLVRTGLLGGMEPFAGEMVLEALRSRGVTVRLGVEPTAVRRREGHVEVTVPDGPALVAEEILVATGRKPRTGDLGLTAVGLEDGAWLPVDDTLLVEAATNEDDPWLYAVGDVNHRALLTHEGKYQGRAAGRVIAARANGDPLDVGAWGRHVSTADHRCVPQVTFTDPEVASVGLIESAAREAGVTVRTAEYDLAGVSGATVFADDYSGRAKIVIDDDRDVVVGATFVGADIGELLHSATVAIVGEVPIQRLWHAVAAYPTFSEIWLRLLETDGRA